MNTAEKSSTQGCEHRYIAVNRIRMYDIGINAPRKQKLYLVVYVTVYRMYWKFCWQHDAFRKVKRILKINKSNLSISNKRIQMNYNYKSNDNTRMKQ